MSLVDRLRRLFPSTTDEDRQVVASFEGELEKIAASLSQQAALMGAGGALVAGGGALALQRPDARQDQLLESFRRISKAEKKKRSNVRAASVAAAAGGGALAGLYAGPKIKKSLEDLAARQAEGLGVHVGEGVGTGLKSSLLRIFKRR